MAAPATADPAPACAGQDLRFWARDVRDAAVEKRLTVREAVARLDVCRRHFPESAWLSFYTAEIERQHASKIEAYEKAERLFGDTFDKIRTLERRALYLGQLLDRVRWSGAGEREDGAQSTLEALERVLSRARALVAASKDPAVALHFDLMDARASLRLNRDWGPALDKLRSVVAQRRPEAVPCDHPSLDTAFAALHSLALLSGILGHTNQVMLSNSRIVALAGRCSDHAGTLSARTFAVAAEYDRLHARLAKAHSRAYFEAQVVDDLEALIETARGWYSEIEAKASLLLAPLVSAERRRLLIASCLAVGRERDLPYCELAEARRVASQDPAAARRRLRSATETLRKLGQRAVLYGWEDRVMTLEALGAREEAIDVAIELMEGVERLRKQQETPLAAAQVLSTWSAVYYWLAGRLLEEDEWDPAGARERRARALGVMERLRVKDLREALLIADMTSLADTGGPVPRFSVGDAIEHLDHDQAIVSFQWAPETNQDRSNAGGTWAIVMTRRRGLESLRLPYLPELEAILVSRDGLADVGLYDLDQLIMVPIVDALPDEVTRLVIVPDGPLHQLRFNVLRSDPEAPAIVERFAVSYVPSVSFWVAARARHRPSLGDRSVALVASPEVPRLPDLRFGLPEARDVSRQLNADTHLLAGPLATESGLRRLFELGLGLVHFAGHAEVDTERPYLSALRLTPDADSDGRLSARELIGFEGQLDDAVVVLSACESHDGPVLRGEGVMSLARAFFFAGATAVVATREKLPDRQAARFFHDFYGHVALGDSLGRALQRTRQRWAARGEPPEVWANVVMLGDAGVVLLPEGNGRSVLARFADELVWQWEMKPRAVASLALASLLALAAGALRVRNR